MVNNRKKRGSFTPTPLVNGNAKYNRAHTKYTELNEGGSSSRDGSDRDSEEMNTGVERESVSRKDAATSPVRSDPVVTSHSNGTDSVPTPTDPSCSGNDETDAIRTDGLSSFLKMSEWEQVETLCELISCVGPYEVRLLGSCIEGAARAQSMSLRPHEVKANCPSFISGISTHLHLSYPDTVDCAFSMICLLHSTNRAGAFAFVRLIDQLMADRNAQLTLLPEEYRLKTLQALGKLVSASLHHPAFSVDQRIRLVRARDTLRNQLERLSVTPSPPVPQSPNNLSHIYIRRFDAILLHPQNQNQFLIEVTWSDGDRTWVNRSRNDIISLHHRLLDLFGEERREAAERDAYSVQSTPTHSGSPSPTTTQVSNGCARILPYFSKDASGQVILDYINGLSDLPARMMLSSVIYEEFFASRNKSKDVQATEQARCTRTTRSPPLSQHKIPVTAPQTFAVATHPLSYGPLASVPVLQVHTPTCSNCAEGHSFVHCDKLNIMDVAQGGKDGYSLKVGETNRSEVRAPNPVRPPPGLPIPGQVSVPPDCATTRYHHPQPSQQPMVLQYYMPPPTIQ